MINTLRILIISNLILIVIHLIILATYGKFSVYVGIIIISAVVGLVTRFQDGRFWQGLVVLTIIIGGIWAMGFTAATLAG